MERRRQAEQRMRSDPNAAQRILQAIAQARESGREPAFEVLGTSEEIGADGAVHVTHNVADTQIEDPVVEIDEFYERALAHQNAMHRTGGDELAALALLAQNQHADLVAQAPFARTTPPSAKDGVLGSTAAVTPGADPIQVANWVGDEAESIPLTITLYSIIGTKSAQGVFRPFARIKWGGRGFQAQADVDIGGGVNGGNQLTLCASSVQVLVGQDQKSASDVGMTLGASIGFYAIGRQAPVTRTVYYDVVGGNKTLKIPNFAQGVMVQTTDAGQALTVEVQAADGATIEHVPIAANSVMTSFLPIAPDGFQLKITTAAANAKAIYQLSM